MSAALQLRRFDGEMKRISAALRSGITGPLIVAEDVVRMADNWELWREQAGGLSATAAFKKWLHFHLPYFSARHHAVELLGRDVRTWMQDTLAVRVAALPEAMRKTVKDDLLERFGSQRGHGHAVTLAQAIPFIREKVGGKPKRGCDECARLRTLLEKHGVKDE